MIRDIYAERCSNDRTGQMAKVSTRKWEMFPGRNRFCFDGRLMMAPHAAVFYINVILIIGTSVLFFVFDCPYLSRRVTPVIPIISGVLFLFVIGSLFKTSFTDPGIIPRATDDEAAYIEKQVYISIPNNGGTPTARPPPRTKEVVVKGHSIKLKYCVTCKIFRPPRASHCSLCNNCVENFDHHCPWVGNCVGRRNYRFFYMFIVCLSLLIIIVFIGAVLHLYYLSENSFMVNAISESPTSVIVVIITFFSCWSVIGLAGFHTFLAASNQTTNEDIKGSFASRTGRPNSNPFSRGNICANYCYVLCSPRPPSLLDRRGVVLSTTESKSMNKSQSNDTVISNKGFEAPDVSVNQNGKTNSDDIQLHQYGSSSMLQPDSLDRNQHQLTTSMPSVHHSQNNHVHQSHIINGLYQKPPTSHSSILIASNHCPNDYFLVPTNPNYFYASLPLRRDRAAMYYSAVSRVPSYRCRNNQKLYYSHCHEHGGTPITRLRNENSVASNTNN